MQKRNQVYFCWLLLGFLVILVGNQAALAATTLTQTTLNYFASPKIPMLCLPRYYQATCTDYTGTWQGFMVETTDLVPNKSWPITVYLYQQGGHLIGHNNLIPGMNLPSQIWAQCQNGVLNQVFWGNKGDCGGFSQHGGMLVSKNTLILELDWQTAMMDGNFLMFLQRKNKIYPYTFPQNQKDLMLGNLTTCH